MLSKLVKAPLLISKQTVYLLLRSFPQQRKISNQNFHHLCILCKIYDISSSYYYYPYRILLDKSDSLMKFLQCMLHMLSHTSCNYYCHRYNILLRKSDIPTKFLHYMFHMLNHRAHNNYYQLNNVLSYMTNIVLILSQNTICNLDDTNFLIN